MTRIPIIIDCDPGIDDAIAIVLAHTSGAFDIKGITPVAGNVPAKFTRENARDISEYFGINCPVAYGADKQLISKHYRASSAHGATGLGEVVLPKAKNDPYERPAWDFIYETARSMPGELTIVAIGPLTNLAIAFMKYPELKTLLKNIYIMGGSTTRGNKNTMAEFNIWVDPHAADIVFKSGVTVYMAGLNVTLKTGLDLEFLKGLSEMESSISDVLKGLVAGYTDVKPDPQGRMSSIIHDAIPFLALIDPTMVKMRACNIVVETDVASGAFGATLPNYTFGRDIKPNCYDITDVDMDKYRALCVNMVKFYSSKEEQANV